jgi:predicted dehydrogenase
MTTSPAPAPLTIAILGCGRRTGAKEGWAIGYAHAEGWRACGRPVRLVAVDPDATNRAAFAQHFAIPPEDTFTDFTAALAAGVPDGVSVCTWPGLHVPLALQAIAAGVRRVVVEKPVALDVGQVRQLQAAADAAGAVVAVAHQRRHAAPVAVLRGVLARGALGSGLRLTARVGGGWDILSWTSHWFDLAADLFDGPPARILAGMACSGQRRYGHAVEDASVVLAVWADGRTATFLTGPGDDFDIEVAGSTGIARLVNDGVACWDAAGHRILPAPSVDPFAILMQEVVLAAEGGPEPRCSLRRSGIGTELCYAAQESARCRAWVDLPLATRFAPLEVLARPMEGPAHGQRVVLLADDHFGGGGRAGLAAALARVTGVAPVVIPAEERGLTTADLAEADAVVVYHTQEHADAITQATLGAWVADGRRLAIVHAGLGAWRHWEDYRRWCGLVWAWGRSTHPIEPMALATSEGDPLGLGFRRAWLPSDEAFIHLEATAPVDVGLTVTIGAGTFPAAWRSRTWPGVRAWMPGHRGDLWTLPVQEAGLAALLS